MADPNLCRLSELVTTLNKSNSSSEKTKALSEFADCKRLLVYIYDTNRYQYGVTADNIRKLYNSSAIDSILATESFHNDTLESLLDDLNNRSVTGHRAIAAIKKFISENSEFSKLILDVIDRNIQVRIGPPIINKVFPGLISEFNISLGYALSDVDPERQDRFL
jgi:hypothetical protein